HLRVASAKALQHRAREIHASIPALVEAEMVVQRAVSTTDLEHPAHAATVPEDAELRAVLAIVLDRARSVLWRRPVGPVFMPLRARRHDRYVLPTVCRPTRVSATSRAASDRE